MKSFKDKPFANIENIGPDQLLKSKKTTKIKNKSLKIFSWGYGGWGNSIQKLLDITTNAERLRGYEPPIFIDIRFSRTVRAIGFHEKNFEKALDAGRYYWFKGLGNAAIIDGTDIRIHNPNEVVELLNLAQEEIKRRRRMIFFCSCPSPESCHRNDVRKLLLSEAKKRDIYLEVAEWPGGEPSSKLAIKVEFSPKIMSQILDGNSRIPIPEDLAIEVFSTMPWGGYIEASDGVRKAIISVGPAQFSAKRWFIEPFIAPVEEGDTIKDLEKTVFEVRDELNYRIFYSRNKLV